MEIDFSRYENASSKFTAELAKRGGYITFSNSGKGGDRKFFTLSLDSFLQVLKDIHLNILEFRVHEEYVEKEWRYLGSEYYQDPTANAMCTVQTKPMFATLSKIVMWANDLTIKDFNPEQKISLDQDKIKQAILKLDSLAATYEPNSIKETGNILLENEILTDSSIRDFALKVFNHFYGKSWNSIIEQCETTDAKINGREFKSLDFYSFKRLLGEFDAPQDKESLKSASTIRYFESPVYVNEGKYYYFTTQWNGVGEYNLSFQNLKDYFETNFNCKLLKEGKSYKLVIDNEEKSEAFELTKFFSSLKDANLRYDNQIGIRLVSSLCTKPFLILTGLTGSGKTKIAQSFAMWISATKDQYEIIPVGADWTNREPLLGYSDGIDDKKYITPESKSLDLIIRAERSDLPHFLILDEMNLSHVERYFADFLSIMESQELAKLYSGANRFDTNGQGIPQEISWPKNLFIIGTVNIDESTYMFSPKVLDRANVIEFRVTENDINEFFKSSSIINTQSLKNKGALMGLDFVKKAINGSMATLSDEHKRILLEFFTELKKLGAEFGYRSASEITRLLYWLKEFGVTNSYESIDIAIMQKLLPKLHGSRTRLQPVLEKLGKLCLKDEANWNDYIKEGVSFDIEKDENIKYKLSFEKIIRMYKNAMANGFASYAEA
jgi:hypothetical protein